MCEGESAPSLEKRNKVSIHTTKRRAGLESGGVKSCFKLEECSKNMPE